MQLYEEMKNSLGNSIDRFPSYSVKLKKKKKQQQQTLEQC